MSTWSCYLAEWYEHGVSDQPFEATAAALATCNALADVTIVTALAVPADDMVVAVFTAKSADAVIEACRRVGLPVQRVSEAIRFGHNP